MGATERYLKRATRGLWGQRKRDAMTELRGAIEDKSYRHRLCGLNESDAERAALRDLGSPTALARELNRVHTGPQVARLTLLLGVVGVLGVQAAAQIPTLHAAPVPVDVTCTYDEAKLARFRPDDQAKIREGIRKAGGRAKYEAACRAHQPDITLNSLLRLSDLVAALRAAHVEVQSLPGLDAYLQLRLPGGDWQSVNLDYAVVPIQSVQAGGATTTEPYFYAVGLIQGLLYAFKGSLSLTGVVNPTLHVGPAQMQLGTDQRPVRATNLYAYLVADEVTNLMTRILPGSVRPPSLGILPEDGPHPGHTQLSIRGAEGGLYALVSTVGGQVETTVHVLHGGRLELPCDCREHPFEQTDDLKTLLDWTQQGKTGLLVYALDASALRNVSLMPVPTAQATRVSEAPK